MIVFAVHRGYYVRKHGEERNTLKKREEGLASKIAGALGMIGFIAMLVYAINPTWLSWASLLFPLWLRWLCVGIALLGFALLQWAQNTLGQNWSDAPKLVSDQAMVARGPYAWARHPIYTAFLLILGSLLLISANWLVGGLWLVSTSLDIAARIRAEEKLLLGRFGEPYRAYMQRTGRLLPRLSRGKQPEA